MTISLHPHKRPQQWSPEERYRFLSTILESFAGTLDLNEVLRRIVNITLALTNTLLHERAVNEMAKASAILDQIPEPAAIYDATGRLERMNAAAAKEPAQLFAGSDPEARLNQYRHADGGGVHKHELPSM